MKKTSSPPPSFSRILLTIMALFFLGIQVYGQNHNGYQIYDKGVRINNQKLSLHPNVPFEIDEPGVVGGRFIVNSDGNIGIGIATPVEKLQVMGNTSISEGLSVGGNAVIQNTLQAEGIRIGLQAQPLPNTLSLHPDVLFQIDEAGIFGGRFTVTQAGNVGVGVADPQAKLEVNGDALIEENVRVRGSSILSGDVTVQNSFMQLSNAPFRLNSETEQGGRLIVDETGNVGIGAVTPTERLEVNGNIKARGKIMADGGIQFGDGSEIIHFGDNGHLGLGVSDPEHKLEVQGSAMVNEHLTVKKNAEVKGRLVVDALEITRYFALDSGARFLLNSDNGDPNKPRFTVDEEGKVGIGTYSPSANLHIIDEGNSSIILNNVGTERGAENDVELVMEADANNLLASIGTQNYRDLRLMTDNKPRLWINAAGDIGIGTEPSTDGNSKGKLHVQGSFHVDNGTDQIFHVSSGKGLVFVGKDAYKYFKDKHPHDHDIPVSDDGKPILATLWVSGGLVTEEVYRTPPEEWPDFVFENTYELPSLEELDQFIKANKHLPDIPEEAHVKEHGYEIFELQYGLLKNLEELTLHTIAQEEKISDLEDRLEEYEHLGQEVEQLKVTLAQLQKGLD